MIVNVKRNLYQSLYHRRFAMMIRKRRGEEKK